MGRIPPQGTTAPAGVEAPFAHWPAPAPPPAEVGGRALFLFLPFYTPPDADRAAELRQCLEHNLATDLFARIVLMIDDGTPVPPRDPRILTLCLAGRPTYLDWIRAARRLCPGHIAVLANSDIRMDASLALIGRIFARDARALVAISRFDQAGAELRPHPRPWLSQDAWAYVPRADEDTTHDSLLAVPLGIPRCDNKIAYLFNCMGFTLYNPFPTVRLVHVHETGRRYYDSRDRRVIGTVAHVHPGATLTDPAEVALEVWTARASQVRRVSVTRHLELWSREADAAAPAGARDG